MCMSRPKMPEPPPPVQQAKEPDTMTARKSNRRNGGMTGTMLTGTGGVAPNTLNTGGSTLLGG